MNTVIGVGWGASTGEYARPKSRPPIATVSAYGPMAWASKVTKTVGKAHTRVEHIPGGIGAARFEKYGITRVEYEAMRDAQSAQCALCDGYFPAHELVPDHDHSRGYTRDAVRSLLCSPCNYQLGVVEKKHCMNDAVSDAPSKPWGKRAHGYLYAFGMANRKFRIDGLPDAIAVHYYTAAQKPKWEGGGAGLAKIAMIAFTPPNARTDASLRWPILLKMRAAAKAAVFAT